MRPLSSTIDVVRPAKGAQAVGDHKCGAPVHGIVHGFEDFAFGFRVDRRGGIVQAAEWRFEQHGPCDGQTLALTAGEAHALFAEDGVVAVHRVR